MKMLIMYLSQVSLNGNELAQPKAPWHLLPLIPTYTCTPHMPTALLNHKTEIYIVADCDNFYEFESSQHHSL